MSRTRLAGCAGQSTRCTTLAASSANGSAWLPTHYGSIQQTAAIAAGIVDKLPLVVVVLLVELANRHGLAQAYYANHGPAAKP